MRPIVPLILLTSLAGCGLHWPRMPWQKPRPKAEYCVVSLQTENAPGIVVGGGTEVTTPCTLGPNSRPVAK